MPRPPLSPSARISVLALCGGLALTAGAAATTGTEPHNLLVVVLDDVGVDKIASYSGSDAPNAPSTPTLAGLARDGVSFRNAWSNPTCSPTRAAALTGQRAERTGIGEGLPPGPGLDPDVRTIADLLGEAGYATAAIGKWHIGAKRNHALQVGFDHHSGTRANVGPGGYFHWQKFVDGVDAGRQRGYATSATADDAVAWINRQAGPWFAWVAFHAPHRPLHAPPAALHTRGSLDSATSPAAALYAAMLEAADRELARVIEAAAPNATVIVFGDNGTYADAIEPPFDPEHAKKSAYQGGVHVPLFVAGKAVAADNRGSSSSALIHVSDLFATLAELAGSTETAEDSISFVPQLRDAHTPGRATVYTSGFQPNGGPPIPERYVRAARNERFKLIRTGGIGSGENRHELYDLIEDPHERHDLAAARERDRAAHLALEALSRVIDAHEWSGPVEPAAARGTLLRFIASLIAVALALTGAMVLRRRQSRRHARPADPTASD